MKFVNEEIDKERSSKPVVTYTVTDPIYDEVKDGERPSGEYVFNDYQCQRYDLKELYEAIEDGDRAEADMKTTYMSTTSTGELPADSDTVKITRNSLLVHHALLEEPPEDLVMHSNKGEVINYLLD